MKFIPYAISLLLSGLVAAIITIPVSFLVGWLEKKVYNEFSGFWTGLWLAGLESFIIVQFSIWVFSWFGFNLPIFYVILITLLWLFNNLNRYYTRPNKTKELGYVIGQLFGIPAIYYQSINELADGVFLFW